MKKIVLFSPGIGTTNIGDQIIYECIREELNQLFGFPLYIDFPTQMPVSKKIYRRFSDADYKIVCGSNLLQSNMIIDLGRRGIMTHQIRQWDISLKDIRSIKPVILFGCGWQKYGHKANFLTKYLWKRILSERMIHSVRDEYTLDKLRQMGVSNVVNTACPTTWKLTPEFCKTIPSKKAKKVVATLTDYGASNAEDEIMLKVLVDNYDTVFLWLQGSGDLEYFKELNSDIQNKITLIPPTLEHYRHLLETEEVDYVGTRLHGGVYALRHRRRAIIIGIDNRAIEMKKDINLPVVLRSEIDELEAVIQSNFETSINLPIDNINKFKQQFLMK